MKKENPLIECACGCKGTLKLYDNHYRKREYISGHNGRKYEDPTQYKREWNHRNREQRQAYKIRRLRKMKSDMVLEAGGECSKCQTKYDGKNSAIFDFHHKDKATKLFNLNQDHLNRRNKKEIRLEFLKCDLLCSNCHRMVHSAEY